MEDESGCLLFPRGHHRSLCHGTQDDPQLRRDSEELDSSIACFAQERRKRKTQSDSSEREAQRGVRGLGR